MGDKKKQKFKGLLAQKALNGEISQALFKKLEIAVDYSDEFKVQELGDVAALAITAWVKRGGLELAWTFHKMACPECSNESFSFENKDLMLVICPHCMGDKTAASPVTSAAQELQGLSVRAREIILGEKTPLPPLTPNRTQELPGLSVQARKIILGEKTPLRPLGPSPIQEMPGLSVQAREILLGAAARSEKLASQGK